MLGHLRLAAGRKAAVSVQVLQHTLVGDDAIVEAKIEASIAMNLKGWGIGLFSRVVGDKWGDSKCQLDPAGSFWRLAWPLDVGTRHCRT